MQPVEISESKVKISYSARSCRLAQQTPRELMFMVMAHFPSFLRKLEKAVAVSGVCSGVLQVLKGITSEGRIYESTLVGQTKLLS